MEDNRGNSFDGQNQNQFNSDNAGIYSPSTSFNYTNGKSNSQSSPSPSNRSRTQQHPKRRGDRFKRESMNQSDKVIKQNDMIIKLLREIRDRLPEPPKATKKPKPQRKQSIYRFDEKDAETQNDVVLDTATVEEVPNTDVLEQTSLELSTAETNPENTEDAKE